FVRAVERKPTRPRGAAQGDPMKRASDPSPQRGEGGEGGFASEPQPPKPKPPTRPWLQRLSLFTGVMVVMAASVLVAWGLRRYLHHSPRFSIATVDVQGNHRLTPLQIAKSAGITTGDNIFDLDEEHAA